MVFQLLQATSASTTVKGGGKKQESSERASWRGKVDLALLSVLRDGLLRRSEAHLLTWADVDFRNNGTALLQLHRSKTDQEGEGVVIYIGKQAADALKTIRPTEKQLDLQAPVFGLSPQQIGRRVTARQRPQAWERVSPATRAAWAWLRTWPAPARSCRRS